ncbi:MAG: PQQ-binding-like beta-propeller repeat protein [Pirellula sp.]|jgi:hypothetical protein|nr:PQQ-binding-like beta-propeller repeat protein [Pirellula sp.]
MADYSNILPGKMPRRATVVSLVVWMCLCSGSYGSDPHWPTIRGTNFDGHSNETGLANRWPAEGPSVLWTRELGQGYSSFVAWDGFVATQYQTLGGQYVVCLDADTGATRWEYRYGWSYDSAGVYPGPRSTPVYNEGCVYFSSPSGLIGCLDATNGRMRWSLELEKTFQIKVPGFGYACSPIVAGENVVLPVGAEEADIVALDKRTGSVRWKGSAPKSRMEQSVKRTSSNASYCSVLPIEFQNRKLVVCFMENSLQCHDLASGAYVWSYPLSSGYDEHSAWPIYKEPFLWMSGPFQRGSELIELTGDPNAPVKSIRQSTLLSNDIFSSVEWDGAIFGFDLQEAQAKTHRTSRGVFRCIDFRTGQELWSVGVGRLRRSATVGPDEKSDVTSVESKPMDTSSIGHCTVVVADSKLILMNDMGELILANADRQRYEELCRTPLLTGEICWTQPALGRQRLFVRNHSRAVCVYLGLPEELEAASKAAATTVRDIPQGKYMDISSSILGVEPEYLFDPPSSIWLVRWYTSCLLLMGAAGVIAYCMTYCFHSKKVLGNSVSSARILSWLLAFVAGALGTTLLSRWTEDFYFTWPLCLYVVWDIVMANTSKRATLRTWKNRIPSSVITLSFIAILLIYFYLCRRLSLVFEWAFLTGFLGSVPFQLLQKKCATDRLTGLLIRCVLACVGFTAYYWLSATVLWMRS